MDWSSIAAILPLGAGGFCIAMFYVALRINFTSRTMVTEADARYTAEVASRDRTEQTLHEQIEAERTRTDAARARARIAEEKLDELLRRTASLQAHIVLLQQRVTELTAEVAGGIPHE